MLGKKEHVKICPMLMDLRLTRAAADEGEEEDEEDPLELELELPAPKAAMSQTLTVLSSDDVAMSPCAVGLRLTHVTAWSWALSVQRGFSGERQS